MLREDIVGTALEKIKIMTSRSTDRMFPNAHAFPGQYAIQDDYWLVDKTHTDTYILTKTHLLNENDW